MESDDIELEWFEKDLLDWMRTVAVFLIVGIAIYHFTVVGKWFALTFFLITAVVMTTLIVDYIQRRHILVSHGLQVRYTVDVLAVSNILTLGVLI